MDLNQAAAGWVPEEMATVGERPVVAAAVPGRGPGERRRPRRCWAASDETPAGPLPIPRYRSSIYAGGTHLAATLVAIRELRPLTDTDAPPVTNPMRATRASSMATGWDCVIFTVVSRGHPIGGHDRWPLPAVSGWPANTCRRRRLTGGMATPRLAPGPRCVAAWSDGRLATTSRRLADLAGLATDGSCGARKLGQAV